MILNNANPSNFQENQSLSGPIKVIFLIICECTSFLVDTTNYVQASKLWFLTGGIRNWSAELSPSTFCEIWLVTQIEPKIKNCKTRNENVKSNPFRQPPLLKINLIIFKPTSDTFFTSSSVSFISSFFTFQIFFILCIMSVISLLSFS